MCKDTLASTTQIVTKLDQSQLQVQRVAIDVQCYQGGFLGIGSCDKQQFMEQVQSQAIGTTTYLRPTSDQLKAAKAAGKPMPTFAIYATRITASNGAVFVFDSPLPVFPYPHSAPIYKDLEGKPAVFTAKVSGGKTAQAQVTVSIEGSTGPQVRMTIELVLNGNTSDHSVYDKFPFPRKATYTIDTVNHDILAMQSSDWFDDENCANNGTVNMNYNLCSKSTGGKVSNFSCPAIQPLN